MKEHDKLAFLCFVNGLARIALVIPEGDVATSLLDD